MYVLLLYLAFALVAGGSRRVRGRLIARAPVMLVITVVAAASYYSLRVVL